MTIKKAKADAIAAAMPKKTIASIKSLKPIPAKLHLKDNDGDLMYGVDGLPITVTCVAMNSKEVALSTEALQQIEATLDEEEAERLTYVWAKDAKLISSVLKDWSHPDFWGGPFTKELAEEIFSDPELIDLKKQITDFAATRTNFSAK